jgi:hypothetical protein
VKHTEQRGIWVATQHLLCDKGKPRKTLIGQELLGRTIRILDTTRTVLKTRGVVRRTHR